MSKDLIKRLSIIVLTIAGLVVCVMFPFNLGLDLQGGTRIVLEAQKNPQKNTIDNDAIDGTVSVIQNRIDGLGVSEPSIRRKGTTQIVVELPGMKNPQQAIALIGETALLEFVEAEWAPPGLQELSTENRDVLAITANARLAQVPFFDDKGHLLQNRPIILKQTALTGADLKLATPATDQFSQPAIAIEFTDEGAKKFRDVTAKSVGKPIAIILDGKVISAPNVNESISGGKAQITGHFTLQEMRELVIKLKAGSLPVPVKIISKTIVGPTLGQDSIDKSKLAGIVGCILVCLFLVAYYRLVGVAACVALGIYIILSAAALKCFGATLTLTGIAGFILSIGVAVDANIIIFERIKEERRLGKSVRDAIQDGFARAYVTVLDANITNLITAVILFWLGTGTIRGFAVTLSVGIMVGMFSAVIVTRVVLDTLVTYIKNPDQTLFKVNN